MTSDIFRVFSSQMVAVLLGIANGFIVPKWLGVSGYADYKTYLLYAGYVGILHFGFADGIYLKYGGKQSGEINSGDLYGEFLFLSFFQLVISFAVLCVAMGFSVDLLLPVALVIVPTNLITFFVFLYQATGRFKEYACYNALRPVLNLLAVVVMIVVLRSRNPWILIWAQVLIPWVLMAGLLRFSGLPLETLSLKRSFRNQEHWNHIRVGLFIMLGNLSGMFFYSMDRWFVKILLPKTQFAYYSFAVSMMGLVLILISAVSMTFYPVLARNQDRTGIVATMRDKLVVLGGIFAGGYFAFAVVTGWFLPEYGESLKVISFLFAGLPAIAVINAIYVNLYKAAKVERKYFGQVALMTMASFSLNVLAVLVHRSNEMIALATTVAFYIWFFCYPRFQPEARPNAKVALFLSLFGVNFLVTSRLLPAVVGGILFLTGQLLISWLLLPKIVQWLFEKGKRLLGRQL